MHYAIINYGRLRSYTDAAGHVTLHFELQQRILEVRYSLSLLYTLGTTGFMDNVLRWYTLYGPG